MSELLTAVSLLVSDDQMHLAALPHVAHTIDAYLWTRADWTLESASTRGCVRLLDRLLKTRWPGFTRECQEQRLCTGIRDAMYRRCDVQVVKWWFSTFMPDQDVFPISKLYELAIRKAHIPVLDWIHETTEGNLPPLQNPLNCIQSPEAMAWLLDHVDGQSFSLLYLNKPVAASFQSIQRCILYQDEHSDFTIRNAEITLETVLTQGTLADLQWMFEHRPAYFGPDLLRDAIRYGNLPAAKWLVEKYPQHYFTNSEQISDKLVDDCSPL